MKIDLLMDLGGKENKVSIVLPLASGGFGSRWEDQELRFALRGVEKHLTGYGDIFLIGHKPSWVQNVIHIPATDEDQTFWKERNIYNKIFIACNDERVSEDFLFMNDDHFLLKDYVAGGFPYYRQGTIVDYITREDQYGNTVKNTFAEIGDVTFYDLHCPMVYNKEFFLWLRPAAWNKKYGYCLKTLYCAQPWYSMHRMMTETDYTDLKINAPLTAQQVREAIAGRDWFSMGNPARAGGIGQVLEELYPKKSKYEK